MDSSALADGELQERIRRQEVIAELGQKALETDDLDQLMHDASVAVAVTLDNEYVKVLELLPGGDDVVLRQGVGWRDGIVGAATVPTDQDSQAGFTLYTEQPIIVDNFENEERFSESELLASHDIVSGISVIIGSAENPWGVLGTHTSEHREFTEYDASFVQSVADILASAIEEQQTKQSLHEEKDQFRSLVEEVEDYAIFRLDQHGHIRSWNKGAEQIKGYAKDEIIGEHISTFYPDEAVEEELPDRLLAEAAANGRTEDEGWRVRKDGSRFWASVSITALHDDGDDIDGFTKVTKDLTERRKRKRKLEESNERLEQFAYAASHDLQEPLRMVSSYLKLLEQRHKDALDEDAEDFLEFAVDGADRMREMIEGLLEYSRVETRGDPLEPVDLDDVFDTARDNLQVIIEESNAEITAEPLPRVQGDETQLQQVFQNLLSNAIKYSGDEPPRVTVEAERERQMWLISVRDEGIGIDPDSEERIFEVFQRLHGREEHAGTGIGLALCQRIVERHGGEIWVESEPDEETTFSFTLPEVRTFDT